MSSSSGTDSDTESSGTSGNESEKPSEPVRPDSAVKRVIP